MANRSQGSRRQGQERSAPVGASTPKRRSAPRRNLPQVPTAGPVMPGLVTIPPDERERQNQKTPLELDELVLPPQPAPQASMAVSPPPGLFWPTAKTLQPHADPEDENMGLLADQFLALLDDGETIELAKLLMMQGYIKEEDVPGISHDDAGMSLRQSTNFRPHVTPKADPGSRPSKGARMMPAVPQMSPAAMLPEPLLSSAPLPHFPDTQAHAGRQELSTMLSLAPGFPEDFIRDDDLVALQATGGAAERSAQVTPSPSAMTGGSQPVHLSTFVGLVSKLQEACTSPMDPMTKLQQLPIIAEHLMSLPGVDPSQWLPTFLQMMQELLATGGSQGPAMQPPIFATSPGVQKVHHQESHSVSAQSDNPPSESMDEELGSVMEHSFLGTRAQRTQAEQSLMSKEAPVTSFIIQNLPLDFNQRQVMDFIDGYGYRDLYDVLLWFPAKKSSRRQTSSAFINLRSPELALVFKTQFHNWKMSDGDAKLNISPAIVQGFTENFVKFWHLTQKDPHSGSICCPYFATDQMEKVTQEDWRRAKEMLDTAGQARGAATEWTATTLVIRNLPDVLATQEKVITWLDDLGHGKGYNFLLYVPKKTNPVVSSVASGAYVFVNYRFPHLAQECFHGLQHKAVDNGATKVVLNVVISKHQGKEACAERFKELAKGGRLVPYVDDRTNEQLDVQQKAQGAQRPTSWLYQ